MNVHMTRSTENQRLASPCRHDLYPLRFFPSCVLVEVLHGSNMMDLDTVCEARRSTQLARLRAQALLNLRSVQPYLVGLVLKVCLNIPCERDSCERYRKNEPLAI